MSYTPQTVWVNDANLQAVNFKSVLLMSNEQVEVLTEKEEIIKFIKANYRCTSRDIIKHLGITIGATKYRLRQIKQLYNSPIDCEMLKVGGAKQYFYWGK